MQDARFVLIGTRQLDIPASQDWCSLWNSNPVPFVSNAITLPT
ncbi:unnamed protein product [Schistosoma margrebowiei]|uniref:Uncharacterized protein n=1 Tax=Schistosoma margrebowiei TaxID=48269 RepID=A0A183LAB2_9TREM|nr:unnamed protein product [Schistosoma margrebowiei]